VLDTAVSALAAVREAQKNYIANQTPETTAALSKALASYNALPTLTEAQLTGGRRRKTRARRGRRYTRRR